MDSEKLSVKASTIVRTIVLAITLINQILSSTGHAIIPIESETVETLVTSIITVVVGVYCFWKNNSFTQAALKADEVMNELKAQSKE